jgi:hypothetical protein
VALFRASKAVALKVNLLPAKVNFLTSAPPVEYKAIFTITGGADVKKFTLAGDRLTFKATAFEARNNATYRVKIKADLGTPASFTQNRPC